MDYLTIANLFPTEEDIYNLVSDLDTREKPTPSKYYLEALETVAEWFKKTSEADKLLSKNFVYLNAESQLFLLEVAIGSCGSLVGLCEYLEHGIAASIRREQKALKEGPRKGPTEADIKDLVDDYTKTIVFYSGILKDRKSTYWNRKNLLLDRRRS
jgi:hypothetical protein